MPYTVRKKKCKQSDGDSGSYVLSYTDKKGKKHTACHTSKKRAQGQIAAIEMSAGRGTYSTTALQYIRITNLDDTNFIRITFSSGSLNRYDMKLPAERTAIFTSPSISGSHVDNDTFGSFVDFQSMKATADTSTVDIELFVAST